MCTQGRINWQWRRKRGPAGCPAPTAREVTVAVDDLAVRMQAGATGAFLGGDDNVVRQPSDTYWVSVHLVMTVALRNMPKMTSWPLTEKAVCARSRQQG